MKSVLKIFVIVAAVSAGAAEFDCNGTFIGGMDGWTSAAREGIIELRTEESGRMEIRLDSRERKHEILVYSRVYGSGMTGEKIRLQATASGIGTGYVGVICFDKNGNQTNIQWCYFRPGKNRETYTFEVVLPESIRKDHTGSLLKTSRTRVMFGVRAGSAVTFSEIRAEGIPTKEGGSL